MPLSTQLSLIVWAVLSYPVWGSLIVYLVRKIAPPRDRNLLTGIHAVLTASIVLSMCFGIMVVGGPNPSGSMAGQAIGQSWWGLISPLISWYLVGCLIWTGYQLFFRRPQDNTTDSFWNGLATVGIGLVAFILFQTLLWIFAFGNGIIQGLLNNL